MISVIIFPMSLIRINGYLCGSATGILFALATSTMVGVVSCIPAAHAETFKLGTQESTALVPAEPISCPQPIVTAEMSETGIKTNCLARFAIAQTGKHTVELLSSTGSGEVDEMTLETLRTWRFRPASLSGTPVASVRKIKVEFEVD